MPYMNTAPSPTERSWHRPLVATVAAGLLLAGCTGQNRTSASSPAAETAAAQPSGLVAANCQPGVANGDGLYCVVQQFGADVFLNYENASGKVAHLAIGQQILVECLEPEATVGSAQGGWYKFPLNQLAGVEDIDHKDAYTVANTFENGNAVGVPIDRQVDPRIPLC